MGVAGGYEKSIGGELTIHGDVSFLFLGTSSLAYGGSGFVMEVNGNSP